MMWAAIAVLTVLILSFAFYIFALKGRTGFADWEPFNKVSFAHRGLHNEKLPENSLGAFKEAKFRGYGVEFDVHLLSDGTLAVFHDSDLLRMTGKEGKIEDLTANDLKAYRLNETEKKIPSFDEVLEVFDNNEPLIIELKAVGNNVAALCKTVCDKLDSYKGVYCLESFDPRCVAWLKKNRPDVLRGQLAENYFKTNSKLPFLLKFVCGALITNVITRPDFVAYRYSDRKSLAFVLCRKFWKIKGVVWTLKFEDEHRNAVEEGLISIFVNFLP